ncbi:MAG: DUF904 domain-containing protein [Pseudomonadota bacterium]|nr:DUF904 domain-containing protein [Pseudomonadota bacterium]
MSEEPELQALQTRLDQLTQMTINLIKERSRMQADEADWKAERVRLRDKHRLVEQRLDAMIERLKSLEQR